MPRCIYKRDWLAVALNRVGANVLRDATAFSRSGIKAQNPSQERCLAMIHVAQKRHDRSPRHLQRGILVNGVKPNEQLLL